MSDNTLLHTLNGHYPGDVGVMVSLLLNHLLLQPGQCIFLSAGLLHAYLNGDGVELMAASDNVVRAGLTPKLKDAPTLCEIMDYRCGGAQLLTPTAVVEAPSPHVPSVARYTPPVPEFETDLVRAPSGEVDMPASDGGSVLMVTEGQGTLQIPDQSDTPIQAGESYFLPAGALPHLSACQDLVAFRTGINSSTSSKL